MPDYYVYKWVTIEDQHEPAFAIFLSRDDCGVCIWRRVFYLYKVVNVIEESMK